MRCGAYAAIFGERDRVLFTRIRPGPSVRDLIAAMRERSPAS